MEILIDMIFDKCHLFIFRLVIYIRWLCLRYSLFEIFDLVSVGFCGRSWCWQANSNKVLDWSHPSRGCSMIGSI